MAGELYCAEGGFLLAFALGCITVLMACHALKTLAEKDKEVK